MRQSTPLLAAILILGGCATIRQPTEAPGPKLIEPFEAILGAANNPAGIHGVFEFTVRGSAQQGDWLFVYSEPDPRDQRCLAVSIPRPVAELLAQDLGGDPAEVLKGRTIRVSGTAKRETIWLYSYGVRTDSYYYRTHVMLTDASKLALVDESPTSTEPKAPGPAESDPDMPAMNRAGGGTRGVPYVDYVPTPEEIKTQLEGDGWKNVKIVHTFPDYLQGPIRAISLFTLGDTGIRNGAAQGEPQDYGRIFADRIEYLNLVLGTNGIVTADLVFPDGRVATTFHMAVKQHYVMIIWDPARRDGYVWRSFIYAPDGTPTEMRFLMQRQDLERI